MTHIEGKRIGVIHLQKYSAWESHQNKSAKKCTVNRAKLSVLFFVSGWGLTVIKNSNIYISAVSSQGQVILVD